MLTLTDQFQDVWLTGCQPKEHHIDVWLARFDRSLSATSCTVSNGSKSFEIELPAIAKNRRSSTIHRNVKIYYAN